MLERQLGTQTHHLGGAHLNKHRLQGNNACHQGGEPGTPSHTEKEHFKGALHWEGALLQIAPMEASTAQQTSSWGNLAVISKCKILGSKTMQGVELPREHSYCQCCYIHFRCMNDKVLLFKKTCLSGARSNIRAGDLISLGLRPREREEKQIKAFEKVSKYLPAKTKTPIFTCSFP